VEAEFDNDPYEPVFEQVTAKPVAVEGGTSDDGLSVEATMDVQLRVPPSTTCEEVREVADGHLESGHVNWHDSVRPTMASPRNDLARAFRVAVRGVDLEPRLLRKTGTADVNIYAGAWDCPMVTYGPGDSDLDHAPDERLPLPELDRATAVLEAAVGRMQ
jgi:LysW-gamma-L-lysine carboxypeptidase